MTRAIAKHKLPKGALDGDERAPYRAALAATAALALVATGGLVQDKSAAPPRHLLALGPHTPAAPPVSTTTAASTTTTKAKPRPTTTTTAPPIPLPRVAAVAPPAGAGGVTTGSRITVLLSGPARPGAPLPTLVPPVAGNWSVNGAAYTFTPALGYVPWSTVRVDVPPALARPKHWSFRVGPPPVLRVQQLLAELHYLPLRFVPATGAPGLTGAPTTASLVPSISQIGSFHWRYPNVPGSLASLWAAGQDNILTMGAIMHFEDDANLAPDGMVEPRVWEALTAAVAKRATNPSPYDYLMVSEALPEELVVWQNGRDVYKTLVNTGVPGATTATGTWPVYARFTSTTMVGTDPDGFHYDVTGVPWVAYFNGGDAVHGYWRYSYGYPQSNGCVELPVDNAQVVWGMDPIGTLVTVSG
jgi:hypothetical protein